MAKDVNKDLNIKFETVRTAKVLRKHANEAIDFLKENKVKKEEDEELRSWNESGDNSISIADLLNK